MPVTTELLSEGPRRTGTAPAPTPGFALTEPEHSLKLRLKAIAAVGAVLALASFVGLVLPFVRAAVRMPPFGSAAPSFLVLVALLALYGGGDPRGRSGLAAVLAGVLGAAGLVTGALQAAGLGAPMPTAVAAPILVVALALAALVLSSAAEARAAARELALPAPRSFWPERPVSPLVRIVLLVAGAVFALEALLMLVAPVVLGGVAAWQPVLTAFGAARAAGLAALCGYILGDARNRLPLAAIVLWSLLASAAGNVLLLPAAAGSGIALGAGSFPAPTVVLVMAGIQAVAALAIFLAVHLDIVARLQPSFLGTAEYRALMGLSAVLVVGPEEAVPPHEIARNVDAYLEKIPATRKWIQRGTLLGLQVHPLLYFSPPLSELDDDGRLQHLKAHFEREGASGSLLPDRIRQFVQAMIRVAKQLTYVGYYADPRSFPLIGYERFSARPRYRDLDARGLVPHNREVPLQVITPEEVDVTVVEADICIVGSGAGGAVLAYHLAEQGKSVVVLEKGGFVQPRDFSEDEVEMIGKLYSDKAFQQTEDFRFTVLQGSCVGGTTVVNNAVCFRTPEPVLQRWNDTYGAGIDPIEYYSSARYIEQWLRIRPQDEHTAWNPNNQLNPSGAVYLGGVASGLPAGELQVGAVNANIEGCLGCGYCNIGCSFGAKLSMLETALPWAQRAFGDRVRIFSDCEVERVVMDGGHPRRAREVRARLADFRPIAVRADKFVISAGAISSPYVLMQSGIGAGLPVGRYACFNMGAPLTAEFEQPLRSFDGLQISHFGVPRPERGWVFETWFNPPVAQALNMPGWFEDHYRNMRRYDHLMAVGCLVGTERNGRIIKALTGGPGVDYAPTQGDLRKLADGLVELGHILFAAGATRVMLNGWNYYEFTSPNGLYDLPRIVSDGSDLTLGTGHPQGGNPIGTDPAISVVGPDFRVHGTANLYVCDASVIPSSLTVNPQLTVMTLAHYAGPRILG